MAGATPDRCRTEDTQTLVEHLTTSATLGRSLEVVGACLATDAIAHTRDSQTCEHVRLVGLDCSTSQNRTERASVGAVAANITRQQTITQRDTKSKQRQNSCKVRHTVHTLRRSHCRLQAEQGHDAHSYASQKGLASTLR